jgi:(E)-4-hydroxy-3-methylbut-2-enyl-diphosphate synthase
MPFDSMNTKYCNNLFAYSRLKTREVTVGNLPMGGYNPIRIQSMTNTNTLDTQQTVEQSIRLIEAGCEYVRISTPGIKEAENLIKIRKALHNRGYDNPLIADIHFNPVVAETAARIVDKIRINPGNYIDKKAFKKINYSDSEYNDELEKLYKRTAPLIAICKEYGTAMRIGVNHGSLSDRIMSRYGDTPLGMVESAVEFVKICEELNFQNLVLSMKASNIKIMVYAYRLLVNRMMDEMIDYPLHLGVTEAGSGMEGRIKSAAGIGTLLEDGIGDTIRVSLTEDPVNEIPVALAIASRYKRRVNHALIPIVDQISWNPYEYRKHSTTENMDIGGSNHCVVISDAPSEDIQKSDYHYDTETGFIQAVSDSNIEFPFLKLQDLPSKRPDIKDICVFIEIDTENFSEELIKAQCKNERSVFVLTSQNAHWMADIRAMFFRLMQMHCKNPVIVKKHYNESENLELYAATDFAALLTDGFCDGIWITAQDTDIEKIEETCFSILQITGNRISHAEFISCPTCARTSYNIFDTLQKIKNYTSHLKGLKIAVMGCVVNGPGEMADADYGYVGNTMGKINLYKGKMLVKRNIKEEDALDELIKLLKENGDWVEETIQD